MEELNELDRWLMDEIAKMHPRKAVRVLGGFFDGTEVDKNGPRFGFHPHDWDGETITVDFRRQK